MKMLINLFFYTKLGLLETVRILGQLLTTLAILLGITIPLAVTQGLSKGLIQQQEQDFLKSPSAIEIMASATGTSGVLTKDREQELTGEHPEITSVIPDITKIADLRCPATGKELRSVTFRCTQEGDPLLGFYQADVLRSGDHGIVLSTYLADLLQIQYEKHDRRCIPKGSQTVELTVQRHEDTEIATQTLKLMVSAVVDFGNAISVAYLDRRLIESIDEYQQGHSVEELDWPGFARVADVGYEAYLAFCKSPYQPLDALKLSAHGLTAKLLDHANSDEHELATLHGLLRDHDFVVYRLFAEGADPQANHRTLLTTPAAEIEDITDSDDVIVSWSAPTDVPLSGEDWRLVGVSVQPRWLKGTFEDGIQPFRAGDNEHRILPIGGLMPQSASLEFALPKGGVLALALPGDAGQPARQPAGRSWTTFLSQWSTPWGNASDLLPIQTVTANKPVINQDDPQPRLAVIPATLLAHFRALERGDVAFDEQLQLFIPIKHASNYYQARVIARDIHCVPVVDAILRKAGFATQSQRTRVEEIQSYARTLHLIVKVVAAVLAAFGLWTLIATLVENTLRKKRMLGTLRSMGASRLAVFYVVLVRGLLIGVIGGLLTYPLAKGLAWGLTELAAPCLVQSLDLYWLFAASIAACFIGSLVPAVMATFSEPGDAIKSGGVY